MRFLPALGTACTFQPVDGPVAGGDDLNFSIIGSERLSQFVEHGDLQFTNTARLAREIGERSNPTQAKSAGAKHDGSAAAGSPGNWNAKLLTAIDIDLLMRFARRAQNHRPGTLPPDPQNAGRIKPALFAPGEHGLIHRDIPGDIVRLGVVPDYHMWWKMQGLEKRPDNESSGRIHGLVK